MKGKFLKKLTAGALAALVMSGGIPMQPIAQWFEGVALTAFATQYATS